MLVSGEPHDTGATRLSLRRTVVLAGALSAGAVGFLYFVLPQLAGLDQTWDRLGRGSPWWLAAAACLELLSFAGYVLLFDAVMRAGGTSLGLRTSYQISLAGLAATRLFATAGAGGIALTAWALRRSGLSARQVLERLTTFLVATYAVFMAALVVTGIGLRTGLFGGAAPFGLTVVPAAFGAAAIASALGLALLRDDGEGRQRSERRRVGRWTRRLAAAPRAVGAGTRGALALLRRREPGLLGAIAWWGFDVAVLWACFEAFGDAPEAAVLVMGYFTGMIANTLPLPGGVGAVEGGMIGAFIAFGVAGGLAIVAVLTYRVFAFWLPTVPGTIAFVQLRRSLHVP